jgi:type I restriction enzyme M protein
VNEKQNSRQHHQERNYDLKAVDPQPQDRKTRTPSELLDLIDAKGKEVATAVAQLRDLFKSR